MEEKKLILLCEDSFEGILSGVYSAWIYKKKYQVMLQTQRSSQLEFFTEYHTLTTDTESAEKVLRKLKKDFSGDVNLGIYRAAMSGKSHKADVIFRFIQDALRIGPSIKSHLALDSVMELYNLERNVWNESHHYMGFIRFIQAGAGVLFSSISPENNVLSMIAPHFEDRLPCEDWIIYDEKRKLAALHKKGESWFLLHEEEINSNIFKEINGEEENIQHLWQTFFHSIAIESRRNKKLQRNMLPLRFRDKMTEFME